MPNGPAGRYASISIRWERGETEGIRRYPNCVKRTFDNHRGMRYKRSLVRDASIAPAKFRKSPITVRGHTMDLLTTISGSLMDGFFPDGWDLKKIDACVDPDPS